ncbi:substrate-binding domain-containing protein [Salmonella enterica subsp. enterica]|nr:substrate-binding domain-containing protein [Salmonella enterica subsp. enterica]
MTCRGWRRCASIPALSPLLSIWDTARVMRYCAPGRGWRLCTNDDIAMGALPWCRERQLAVPEQTSSIAGFHGLEMGRQMIPSLASVIPLVLRSGAEPRRCCSTKIKNNDPTIIRLIWVIRFITAARYKFFDSLFPRSLPELTRSQKRQVTHHIIRVILCGCRMAA